MNACSPRILGVSDVSLGYGSPQIPALVNSLIDHYGTVRATVLEPDQSERPPRPELFPRLDLVRLPTHSNHYAAAGQVEYNRQVARVLRELRPDVLVLASSLVLPGYLQSGIRPRCTLYYMLESLSYYAQSSSRYGRFAVRANQAAASQIDVTIFPEENRAMHDLVLGGFQDRPLVVMYNTKARVSDLRHVLPTRQRLPRILYTGTIHRQLTLADYFLRAEISDVPIDLWGLIDGEGKEELEEGLTSGDCVRYRGYVDGAALAEQRRRYAYSIVLWAPIDTHTHFAAPNKFFEAIADGVPPIAAPHPQCRLLVERYRCGILMKDWSFAAFREALEQALALFGTPAYEQMVANCRRAVEHELNWDAQFAKLRPHLPDLTELRPAQMTRVHGSHRELGPRGLWQRWRTRLQDTTR